MSKSSIEPRNHPTLAKFRSFWLSKGSQKARCAWQKGCDHSMSRLGSVFGAGHLPVVLRPIYGGRQRLAAGLQPRMPL